MGICKICSCLFLCVVCAFCSHGFCVYASYAAPVSWLWGYSICEYSVASLASVSHLVLPVWFPLSVWATVTVEVNSSFCFSFVPWYIDHSLYYIDYALHLHVLSRDHLWPLSLQSYVTQAQTASEKWKQEVEGYAETLTEEERRQIQEYHQRKKEDAQRRQKRAEVSYCQFAVMTCLFRLDSHVCGIQNEIILMLCW